MSGAAADWGTGVPEEGRILIRANNWIGDLVMATPALRAVRAAFPRAHVSVLAKPWVLPLLDHHPAVDRLLRYDAAERHRGATGRLRLAADLRRERFDAALLLQRAFEAALVTWAARIPRRAGLASDGRSLLLTHPVRADRSIMETHRVRHNLELLARVGIPPAGTDLDLPVGRAVLARAEEALSAARFPPDRLCFGLNPGAAFGSAKRWHPERFAAVSARLARAYGARGLIFGSASERDLGEAVASMAPDAGLLNLAGATTLEEAVALIALCGLFISNDSGLMHVAAALDVPLVSIFGPTNPSMTAPWCRRHRLVRKEGLRCAPCMQRECPEKHHLCMESISGDEVFSVARDLLARYGASTPEERRSVVPVSDRSVPLSDLGPPRPRCPAPEDPSRAR